MTAHFGEREHYRGPVNPAALRSPARVSLDMIAEQVRSDTLREVAAWLRCTWLPAKPWSRHEIALRIEAAADTGTPLEVQNRRGRYAETG